MQSFGSAVLSELSIHLRHRIVLYLFLLLTADYAIAITAKANFVCDLSRVGMDAELSGSIIIKYVPRRPNAIISSHSASDLLLL